MVIPFLPCRGDVFPGFGIGTGPSLGAIILLTTYKHEEVLFFLFIQFLKKSYSLYIGGSRKVDLKEIPPLVEFTTQKVPNGSR